MAQTYDDKAIKGSDLESVLTSVASEIKKKQDVLDVTYDASNQRLCFTNMDIEIPQGD